MRWVEDGAVTVAALRALYVSGGNLWDGFWSQPPPRRRVKVTQVKDAHSTHDCMDVQARPPGSGKSFDFDIHNTAENLALPAGLMDRPALHGPARVADDPRLGQLADQTLALRLRRLQLLANTP